MSNASEVSIEARMDVLSAAPSPSAPKSRAEKGTSLKYEPAVEGARRSTIADLAKRAARRKPRVLPKPCNDCSTRHDQYQCYKCTTYCVAVRGDQLECQRCHVIIGFVQNSKDEEA